MDERIIGAVPIVMDFLHFQANMHHMYKAYGGWTFAFTVRSPVCRVWPVVSVGRAIVALRRCEGESSSALRF